MVPTGLQTKFRPVSCANFHSSEPIFEMLILLFTDCNRPLNFAQDFDIEGKKACAVPKGILSMIWDEKVGIGFIKELSFS